jgi:hypothetical protein
VDDMTLVAGLRDQAGDPDPRVLEDARAALLRHARSAPAPQPRRLGRLLHWPVPLAAGLVASAATLTAVTLAASPSHAPGGGGAVRLAAVSTVTKQPDGRIKVTIGAMLDPVKLQRELRADGVPANISVQKLQQGADGAWGAPYGIPSCTILPREGKLPDLWDKIFLGPSHPGIDFTFWIDPTAIPAGLGIALQVEQGPHVQSPDHAPWVKQAERLGVVGVNPDMVKASQQCTGS